MTDTHLPLNATAQTSQQKPGIRPPKNLLRPVGRAISDYQMIQAGDRLLLGP